MASAEMAMMKTSHETLRSTPPSRVWDRHGMRCSRCRRGRRQRWAGCSSLPSGTWSGVSSRGRPDGWPILCRQMASAASRWRCRVGDDDPEHVRARMGG